MYLADLEWMGNTTINFAMAAVAALVILLLVPVIKNLALRFSQNHASDHSVTVWNLLATCLSKTYFPVILVYAIYAGSKLLFLPPKVQSLIDVVVIFASFLQVAIWVNAAVNLYTENYRNKLAESEQQASTALTLISFFAKTVGIALILLVALDQLGVNITTLVAGLGVGGIAIALAVQNILGDLFASLSIVLDKPFRVGDFLVIDDFVGTVERVGLKTTRLKSLSGEQLIFANTDLLKSRIRNFKQLEERRIVFNFGIVYETPLEKVKQVADWAKEVVESQEDVRFDRSHFKGFGAYSLDYEVVYFVLGPEFNKYMDLQQKINLGLFAKFQNEGVEFAYPTQKLFMENHLVEGDGDSRDSNNGHGKNSSELRPPQ